MSSCEPPEARLEQKPHTHSNPTNLELFGHKIALYRFNQGGSYYCRGRAQIGVGRAEPLAPLTLTTANWSHIIIKMLNAM